MSSFISMRRSRRSLGLTSLHFFVAGLMMALGFGTVLAQPTATPPSGTVSPNFSSVNVSGTTTSANVTVSGTLSSTGTTVISGDLQGAGGLFEATTAGDGRIYLGGNDAETTQVYPDGRIQSNTVNKPYAFWGSNSTSSANNAGVKGTVGSIHGYLGFIDSAGSYGLYTPNNAKVVGTFTAAGAAMLNGAISSSTGSLNLNDDTAITGNATVSGSATVTGASILNGNVSDSGGALVLNDDVQVGVTSAVYAAGYLAKLFTGALSSVAYSTHAEFGNFDIASTDDLFVDDKAFVGNTIDAGGDITAGDDLVADDDVNAADDVIAGDDVIATGSITASSIGNFYTRSAHVSLNTTGVFSFKLGCLAGDFVTACSGRTEETGAIYMGSKPVTGDMNTTSGDLGNSSTYGYLPDSNPSTTQGCEVFGAKNTASSGTDLNVYTFCFSPNG